MLLWRRPHTITLQNLPHHLKSEWGFRSLFELQNSGGALQWEILWPAALCLRRRPPPGDRFEYFRERGGEEEAGGGLEKVETRISSFLLSRSPPKRSATPFFFPNRGVPFCSCGRIKAGIRPRERIKRFWYAEGITF